MSADFHRCLPSQNGLANRLLMYMTTPLWVGRSSNRPICPKGGHLMVFGMTPFTFFHVLLSLAGIFTGFIALFGMIAGKRLDGWNGIFLLTTALTSITGFFFPFHGVTPAIKLGVISLVVLAVAIPARYVKHLAGAWRKIYAVTASIAL